MKAIKHLINIAFLWAIPYVCLVFFWILTLCQFSYMAVVTSGIWAVVVAFYSFMTLILYSLNNGSEDDIKIV